MKDLNESNHIYGIDLFRCLGTDKLQQLLYLNREQFGNMLGDKGLERYLIDRGSSEDIFKEVCGLSGEPFDYLRLDFREDRLNVIIDEVGIRV